MTSAPDPDRPTLGEVVRRIEQLSQDQRRGLDAINTRLDKVVSQDVYAAERTRLEEKIAACQTELAAKRITHENDMQRVDGELDRVEREWREQRDADQQREQDRRTQRMLTGVLPGLFTGMGLVVTVWLALRGGR